MIEVPIGINVVDKKPVYYKDRMWGVCQIFAKPRYGKTSLGKNIAIQMSKIRPVLIFDFYNDWQGLGKLNRDLLDTKNEYADFVKESLHQSIGKNELNLPGKSAGRFFPTSPDMIEDLIVVNDPRFAISDFSESTDWIGLGFPVEGARALSQIAVRKDVHKDNPEKFEELIRDLPVTEMEAIKFNKKYGDLGLRSRPVFAQSKQSLIVRWEYIRDFFDKQKEIDNWGAFMFENRHVVVNFDITNEPSKGVFKAKAITGIILRKLNSRPQNSDKTYLEMLKPAIFFEECDHLAPADVPLDQVNTCADMMVQFSLKYQRAGVTLFLISQDPRNIDVRLLRNFHYKILGMIPKGSPDYDLTEKLQWNPDANMRQFILIHQNGYWEPFWPFPMWC